jgi:hypothetical protein
MIILDYIKGIPCMMWIPILLEFIIVQRYRRISDKTIMSYHQVYSSQERHEKQDVASW